MPLGANDAAAEAAKAAVDTYRSVGAAHAYILQKPVLLSENVRWDFLGDIHRSGFVSNDPHFSITWVVPKSDAPEETHEIIIDIGAASQRDSAAMKAYRAEDFSGDTKKEQAYLEAQFPSYLQYNQLLHEQLPGLDASIQRVTLALLATLNGQGNAEVRSIFTEFERVYGAADPVWAWRIEQIRPGTYAVLLTQCFEKAHGLKFVKSMLVAYDDSDNLCRHMILDERLEVPKGVPLADCLGQVQMDERWKDWYQPNLALYRKADDLLKANESVQVPLATPVDFRGTMCLLAQDISRHYFKSDREVLFLRDPVPPILDWVGEKRIGLQSARANLLVAYRAMGYQNFIDYMSKEWFDAYTSLPMLTVAEAERFVHYKTLAACINNPSESDEAILAYLDSVDFMGLFANRLCEHPDWYYLFLIMVHVHPDRFYLLLNAPVFQARLAALHDMGRVHLYKYLYAQQVNCVPTDLREKAEQGRAVAPVPQAIRPRASYRSTFMNIVYLPGYSKRDAFDADAWRRRLYLDLKRLPMMERLVLCLSDRRGDEVRIDLPKRFFMRAIEEAMAFDKSDQEYTDDFWVFLKGFAKRYSLTPTEYQSLVDLFDVIYLKHKDLSISTQKAFLGMVSVLGQGALQARSRFVEFGVTFHFHSPYQARWRVREVDAGVCLFEAAEFHQGFAATSAYLLACETDGAYQCLTMDARLHLTNPDHDLMSLLDETHRLSTAKYAESDSTYKYVHRTMPLLYVPIGDTPPMGRSDPIRVKDHVTDDVVREGLSGSLHFDHNSNDVCLKSKDPVPAILAADQDMARKRVALTYAYRCSVFPMGVAFNADLDETLYTWLPHLSIEVASKLGTAECLAGALNNLNNTDEELSAFLDDLQQQGTSFADLLPYRLLEHPEWFYAFLVLVWVQPERIPLLVNSPWFLDQVAQLDEAGLVHLETYLYPEQFKQMPPIVFNFDWLQVRSDLPAERYEDWMDWGQSHTKEPNALYLAHRQLVCSGGVGAVSKMIEAEGAKPENQQGKGVPVWMVFKQCMWGAPWHTLRPTEMLLRFLALCLVGGVLGVVLSMAWPGLFAVGAAFIADMPMVVGLVVGIVGVLGVSLFADTMKTPMRAYRYPKWNMFLRAIGIGLAFAIVGVVCAPVAVVHLAKALGGPAAAKWAAMMARHWGSAWVVLCVLGVGAAIHTGFSIIYGALSALAVKVGRPWLAKGILAGHFLLSGLTAFAVFALHGAQAIATGVHVATQGWFKGLFGSKVGLEVGLPAMHVVVAPAVAAVSLVAEVADEAVEEVDKQSEEAREGSWGQLEP